MTAHPVIAAPPALVRVTLPIKTVTEGNAKEHWRTKSRRAKRQASLVREVLPWHCLAAGLGRGECGCLTMPPGGLWVRLTRIAPPRSRGLDPHDNLPGSQKHVVDAIARLFGVDDADKRWTWLYAQRRATGAEELGTVRGYGVLVEVRASEDPKAVSP